MKITLSKPELLKIVSTALGQDVTDLTITHGDRTKAQRVISAMSRKFGADTMQHITTNALQKIPAIKYLREVIPGLGLADAKHAIENWGVWIAFVKQYGRVPNIVSQYGEPVRYS